MPNLFANFEVNREPRWHGLLALVGLSLFLHGTAVALVVYVPAVRDTLNIATLVGSTGYSDRPYERTKVGEAVEIIEVEKFRYPPGYFAVDDPMADAAAEGTASMAPKIISEARNQPKEGEPTPTPTPAPEASPTLTAGNESATNDQIVNSNVGETEPKSAAQADEELDKIAADNSVLRPSEKDINTRPLKDWLARANELKEKGELDLGSQVEITIAATLNSDCKLDEAVVKQKSGDARLIGVARDMVSAISDSRMLSFLRDPKKINDPNEMQCEPIPLQLSLRLDQNEISARVESQADSAERASEMARGYNGLLTLGQFAKRGHDEEVLYKSTQVTAEGRLIIVSFSMPRQMAGEMLKKQLPHPAG